MSQIFVSQKQFFVSFKKISIYHTFSKKRPNVCLKILALKELFIQEERLIERGVYF